MTILTYTVGLFERRRMRRLLVDKGFDYTESRGVFFVEAEIDEHIELSKEFYNA